MRTAPILSGYMIRNFLLAFIATLAVVAGLILLFDTIELLRRTASKDVGFPLVLSLAFMKLPNMIYIVLPFAVLLGAMIVFWRMTRSHELVVIRAAGVSVWTFLSPILLTTFLIGFFNITAFNPLSAVLYQHYEQYQDKLQMRHENPLVISQQGLWLREARPDGGQAVVNAEHVRQEGMDLFMRNIMILDVTESGGFVRRIEAETGQLGDGVFHLKGVHKFIPGDATEHLPRLDHPTSLTLGKIQERFASPQTLSFWELPRFIEFFESAGFSAHRQRLHWWSLLVSPFLLCAMVLVAAVFALKPNQRGGGILFRVTAGAGAGFLLYFFSRLTYALGLSETLPISLAAWSPTLISTFLSVSYLLHREDG